MDDWDAILASEGGVTTIPEPAKKSKKSKKKDKKKKQKAAATTTTTATAATEDDPWAIILADEEETTDKPAPAEKTEVDEDEEEVDEDGDTVVDAAAYLASMTMNDNSNSKKNKKNKKKKGGNAKVEGSPKVDDDWELLLAADTSANESSTAPTIKSEEPKADATLATATDEILSSADAYLASLGVNNEPEGGSKKKNKKKKGKKKGAVADIKKAPTLSKAAQAAQAALAAKKAQEESLAAAEATRKAQEEEEDRKRIEEENIVEEIARKKREKAKAKKERQKAAGTYMTKAQKAKAAKDANALRFLQESTSLGHANDDSESGAASKPKRVVYGKKNHKNKHKKKVEEEKPIVVENADDDDGPGGIEFSLDDFDLDNVDINFDDEPEKPTEVEDEEVEEVGDDDDDEPLPDFSHISDKAERKYEIASYKRERRQENALKTKTKDNLRSPVICVMGHVDTGKTKLLDRIRRSDVQGGEAGGITQQIGATFMPLEIIEAQTKKLNESFGLKYNIPGLLVIDTPGHESFSNLRNRGSTLCDFAIVVVDIMHGLEPQTIESLNMLRKKKIQFIVALNKIDRLYQWKTNRNSPVRETLADQNESVIREFESRTQETILQFNENGLNAALYWENKDYKSYVSLVPTSAHTGEGIPDLLLLLTQLTQSRMIERLQWYNWVQCTVLEVKVIEGLGTTIDVLLLNGTLHRGDTIVLCGLNGPVVTQVRALLTPYHMKEMRVAKDFQHWDKIDQAMGVKIAAMGVDQVIAGTPLLVQAKGDNLEELEDEVMEQLSTIEGSLKKEGRGVFVQASTLGSLEALLEFLRTLKPPIPVSGYNIGPVHKRDVMQCAVQLEHKPEYATILAFDVPITRDASNKATELGVRIFTAEIIYHLFDQFTNYLDELAKAKKSSASDAAVFPCILKILPEFVFNQKNPIILGCDVVEGVLKIGTQIAVVRKDESGVLKPLRIGKVCSIERDHKEIKVAKPGGSAVAVRIEPNDGEEYIAYGRHFDATSPLYSRLTRKSIDLLKENFKDDLNKEEWMLVVKLKKILGIQ